MARKVSKNIAKARAAITQPAYPLADAVSLLQKVTVTGEGVVWVDGQRVEAIRAGDRLKVAGEWSGRHQVEIG